VVSLYELGILPESMSIREVQWLVNGQNRFSSIYKVLDGLGGRNMGVLGNDENRFCLMAGYTDDTNFFPLAIITLFFISEILAMLTYTLIIPVLWFIAINPINIINCIFLGYKGGMSSNPASGWIHTIGLNGIKSWDGDFLGDIQIPGSEVAYLGVFGFSGIKILLDKSSYLEYFYLGGALQVKIKE
jgi:hypothetical protein